MTCSFLGMVQASLCSYSIRLVKCITQFLHIPLYKRVVSRFVPEREMFSLSLWWWICPFSFVGLPAFALYIPLCATPAHCCVGCPGLCGPWCHLLTSWRCLALSHLLRHNFLLHILHSLFSVWPSAVRVSFHVLVPWEFSFLFLRIQPVKCSFLTSTWISVEEVWKEAK